MWVGMHVWLKALLKIDLFIWVAAAGLKPLVQFLGLISFIKSG